MGRGHDLYCGGSKKKTRYMTIRKVEMKGGGEGGWKRKGVVTRLTYTCRNHATELGPESVELFIKEQAVSRIYDLAPPPLYSPFFCQ
jgi:hypothetical protein